MTKEAAKLYEMHGKWHYRVGDLSCDGFNSQLEAATEAVRCLVASSTKMRELLSGKPLESQIRCVFGGRVWQELFEGIKF